MSLRKSPTRTPALLAANRANAQKCTGPRTPDGKARVALNALRDGLKARDLFSLLAKSGRALEEYKGLYLALYAALLPDKTDEAAMDLLNGTVLYVWVLKQGLMRWVNSPAEREAWFTQTGGLCPAPEQIVIQRPGWRVRVSVWVRWGRGRGRRRWFDAAAGWKERRARLHVVVTITASIGHPLLKCSRTGDVPEGVAPRVAFRTKPECVRKQKGNKNVIGPSRIRQGGAPIAPISRAGRTRAGLKPGATGHGKDGATSWDQDPIARQLASETGDLLSWLRPENVLLSGPRFSESNDVEGWIEGIVTKWEKEHGPIPKNEVMFHEISEAGSAVGSLPNKTGMYKKTKG